MRRAVHAVRPAPRSLRALRVLPRALRVLARALRVLPRGLPALSRALSGALPALWSTLRALSGDDAYERYRLHHAAHHPCEALLSRRAFCEDQLRRKWSGVSRCC